MQKEPNMPTREEELKAAVGIAQMQLNDIASSKIVSKRYTHDEAISIAKDALYIARLDYIEHQVAQLKTKLEER